MTGTQKTLLLLALFVIPVGLFVLFHGFVAHANAYNLYATKCAGGWEHPELATGRAPIWPVDGEIALDDTNAATARGTDAAQIVCNGFRGDIVAGSVPKKINVRFLWDAHYPGEVPTLPMPTPLVASGTQEADAPPVTVVGSLDGSASGTSAQLLIADAPTSTATDTGSQLPVTSDKSSTATTATDTAGASVSAQTLDTNASSSGSSGEAPSSASTATSDTTPVPAPAIDSSPAPQAAPVTPPATSPADAAAAPPAASSPSPASAPTTDSAPAPTPAPAPAASAPVSFLDFFATDAFADELASGTTDSVIAPVTTADASSAPIVAPLVASDTAPSSAFASGSPVVPEISDSAASSTADGILEVLYSTDGTTWKSLGFVGKDELQSKEFEIPIEDAAHWDDISHIDVGVRSVPTLDGIAPIVHLGAVWLEVQYDKGAKELNPVPAAWRGDVILGEADYGDRAVVLVARPRAEDAITLSDVSSTSSSDDVTTEASSSPPIQVASSSPSGDATTSTSALSGPPAATDSQESVASATVSDDASGSIMVAPILPDAASGTPLVASNTLPVLASASSTDSGTTTELWLRDDSNGTSTPVWSFISSDVDEHTKVYFRDNSIFWLGATILTRFDPGSRAFDSISYENGTPAIMHYEDEAGMPRIALVEGGDVAFEPYIAPQ